jgi:hypothetical protein
MGVISLNKKGIFFTIIAIILLSFFLISFSFYSFIEDRGPINKRVTTLNNFVFSLEKDLSRQGYISGYRAILSIEDYITSTGLFLEDAESSIKEAILNGTIKNETLNLMEGYRLPELNLRISEFGNKMNLIVNYSLKNIYVSQEDPWNVKIDMEMEIFIKDKNNLASWNKTEIISSKIEIIDFEDPFYVINTNGLVVNKITRTSYEPFVSGNNVTNLFLHVNSSNYIASSLAPSFLDRLEGKTNANINGVESLVYLPDLSSQGLKIKEKSVVDYIYFSDEGDGSYVVDGMPYWFRIDEVHLDIYGVRDLI